MVAGSSPAGCKPSLRADLQAILAQITAALGLGANGSPAFSPEPTWTGEAGRALGKPETSTKAGAASVVTLEHQTREPTRKLARNSNYPAAKETRWPYV